MMHAHGAYSLRGKNNIHDADADVAYLSQQRMKRSARGGEKWHMHRRAMSLCQNCKEKISDMKLCDASLMYDHRRVY